MEKQDAGSGLGQLSNEEKTGGRGERSRAARAPRPGKHRKFIRARFAEALPEVATKLLEEAKKGSVAHLKLLMLIGGLDKVDIPPVRGKKREKTLEEILTEAWDKEAAEELRAGVTAEIFPDTSGD